jgi:hypothetical protein
VGRLNGSKASKSATLYAASDLAVWLTSQLPSRGESPDGIFGQIRFDRGALEQSVLQNPPGDYASHGKERTESRGCPLVGGRLMRPKALFGRAEPLRDASAHGLVATHSGL